MKAKVIGLDRFGLDPSALRRLGALDLEVIVSLRSFEVDQAVARRKPEARHAFLRSRVEGWLVSLRAAFPKAAWATTRSARDIPTEVGGGVSSRQLLRLARQPGVRLIQVTRVPGHRRRRPRPSPDQWFCVRGRVAIQIEGRTRGLQTVEDRFVLVQAKSIDEADRRLRDNWHEYSEPYLNSEGHVVRWALEEITDVYASFEYPNLEGREVYSKLGTRRMKPEFVWRPRAGDLKQSKAAIDRVPRTGA